MENACELAASALVLRVEECEGHRREERRDRVALLQVCLDLRPELLREVGSEELHLADGVASEIEHRVTVGVARVQVVTARLGQVDAVPAKLGRWCDNVQAPGHSVAAHPVSRSTALRNSSIFSLKTVFSRSFCVSSAFTCLRSSPHSVCSSSEPAAAAAPSAALPSSAAADCRTSSCIRRDRTRACSTRTVATLGQCGGDAVVMRWRHGGSPSDAAQKRVATHGGAAPVARRWSPAPRWRSDSPIDGAP